MRKSLLLIAAAMVVLCFTQCKKQRPSNPYMGKKTGNISFTASPSGGDSRNHFTDPMTGGLNFTWDAGDKIYVYYSSDADFENHGCYGGYLDIDPNDVGKEYAKFTGSVQYINSTGAYLRFYYFGKDLTISGNQTTAGSDVSTTADFATQNGNSETVSRKLIALYECPVNENNKLISDYGGTLEVQFAIVKARFKGFNENSDMSVQGLSHTGVNVSGKGVISYNSGTTSNLGKPTYKTTGEFSEPYYIVFMDEDDGSETDAKNAHQFYDSDSKNSTVQGELHKGIFYTKKENLGQPIEIIAGTDLIIINNSTGGNQGDGQ